MSDEATARLYIGTVGGEMIGDMKIPETPFRHNDGSINIMVGVPGGDPLTMMQVHLFRQDVKRNERYKCDDPEQMAFAEKVVAAFNTHDAALTALSDCRAHIQYELNTSSGLQTFRDEECSLLIARIDALLAPDGQENKEG